MAEPVALRLLRTGNWPADWLPGGCTAVMLAEGETDFLAWSSWELDHCAHRAPAVFGVFAGAWTAEHRERLPTGADLWLSVDVDADGQPDGGATELLEKLGTVKQWTPSLGRDACEHMRAGGVLRV